jgi:hypothetical protein
MVLCDLMSCSTTTCYAVQCDVMFRLSGIV